MLKALFTIPIMQIFAMSIDDPRFTCKHVTRKLSVSNQAYTTFSAMSDINSQLFSTPFQENERSYDMNKLSENFNDIYDQPGFSSSRSKSDRVGSENGFKS